MSASDRDSRSSPEALRDKLWEWIEAYVAEGYALFPVGPDKKPLVKWKDGATSDLAQLRAWWTKWPTAMIGLPTGERNGITVLDVDCKNGANGFNSLAENGWVIPLGVVEVKTPSGGSHFYFEYESGFKTTAGKIGHGLDVRNDGGYVVAPPSRPLWDGSKGEYAYAEGQPCEPGRLLW
jgi:hypothetical protein